VVFSVVFSGTSCFENLRVKSKRDLRWRRKSQGELTQCSLTVTEETSSIGARRSTLLGFRFVTVTTLVKSTNVCTMTSESPVVVELSSIDQASSGGYQPFVLHILFAPRTEYFDLRRQQASMARIGARGVEVESNGYRLGVFEEK
jgi:hypothetical protein